MIKIVFKYIRRKFSCDIHPIIPPTLKVYYCCKINTKLVKVRKGEKIGFDKFKYHT